MPTVTPNLGLIKPLVTENYTVEVANDNADILDEVIHDLDVAKVELPTVDKVTPVDADSVFLIDSEASNVVKKWTWANIKTILQEKLVSGTNIKTINGEAILGSGNVAISNAKNQIINGNFQVNQRAKSGTVVLTSEQYGHDRFKAGASGCTYTFATIENITTLTISAGSLIQVIEGLNLETDTYCLSWEGTSQGKIGGGAYGASGITGSVVGGTNLNIEFNTGTLRKISLVKGSLPSVFIVQPYADVLRECQRYYIKFTIDSPYGFLGIAKGYDVNTLTGILTFPVPMRVTPTSIETSAMNTFLMGSGNSSVTTPTSIVLATVSSKFIGMFDITKSNSFTGTLFYSIQGYNNSSAYIGFSAEL